jgi:protease-4
VLATVSDGRIFTGKQALDLKLIDEIGDENTAVAWLEANKSVPKDLDIEDWEKSSDSHGIGFARAALAGLAEALGLTTVADLLRAGSQAPGTLDGLISVWQPRAQN